MQSDVPRRKLLGVLATLPAAATASAAAQPPSPQSSAPSSQAAPASPAGSVVYQFLNSEEARTLDAIVARLVPADDLGPGAREAGVTVFIDRQLAGAWGHGSQLYMHGPFAQGTPQQGYQLPFTPAQMFRPGLRLFDERCAATNHGKHFADCAADVQDQVLTALQEGHLDIAPIPPTAFFDALLDATMEGFFSDPVYGGNRDMVAWKLIGFPGAYDSYANEIELWNMNWTRAPISMESGDVDPHEAMSMGAQR